jgi:hypothetical protein
VWWNVDCSELSDPSLKSSEHRSRAAFIPHDDLAGKPHPPKQAAIFMYDFPWSIMDVVIRNDDQRG